ncbi:metallophosphoesterase family protein [Saliniramus sp.]|uniref:metallophosphoesterase family protein n=1 Tax=Saliniramus sp. TaxID=2986772 RepID=UPI002BC426D2|nr:metallophosphoesterase [Saliniramus sp.]HMB11593.1 metallophosphoesterase [Saliniramus sp.]
MAEAEDNNRKLLIDPRKGDVEDDAASPRDRSLLIMAGAMLVEINFLKLALAIVLMIIVPAIVLGLAPLVVTGWYIQVSRGFTTLTTGLLPALATLVIVGLAAWYGGKPLFRTAERSFWSLISLVVQPGYAFFREALRHLGERVIPYGTAPRTHRAFSAIATAVAGLALSAIALWLAWLAWPETRWVGSVSDLRVPQRLILPTLANSAVLIGLFLGVAALVWSLADATMAQPRDYDDFDLQEPGRPIWRVAQLSDLHAVGSAFEFRIEAGRRGPRGNGKIETALAALSRAHAQTPLDIVLMSGDMTDCGRSTEWAEFFAILDRHPDLRERCLMLPGNHDLNVVDRSNPARLELPLSIGKNLRQMRSLSAMAAVQGERVLVMDHRAGRFARTLNTALAPYRETIAAFADTGNFRASLQVSRIWDEVFPMIVPPRPDDGLGVILLNSNAEANFSFTNALGLVPSEQMRDLTIATRQFPHARWLIALHHHLIEYPKPVSAFAARIGTALINGSAFVRKIKPLGRRAIAMHGHRHIDWVGACGATRIISAPSPVMSPMAQPYFYIHRFAAGADGDLDLLLPERVSLGEEAQPPAMAVS